VVKISISRQIIDLTPILFEAEIHVKPQMVSESDLDSDEMNSSFPKANPKPRESSLQLSASLTP
jgi:hypothetical protein